MGVQGVFCCLCHLWRWLWAFSSPLGLQALLVSQCLAEIQPQPQIAVLGSHSRMLYCGLFRTRSGELGWEEESKVFT